MTDLGTVTRCALEPPSNHLSPLSRCQGDPPLARRSLWGSSMIYKVSIRRLDDSSGKGSPSIFHRDTSMAVWTRQVSGGPNYGSKGDVYTIGELLLIRAYQLCAYLLSGCRRLPTWQHSSQSGLEFGLLGANNALDESWLVFLLYLVILNPYHSLPCPPACHFVLWGELQVSEIKSRRIGGVLTLKSSIYI